MLFLKNHSFCGDDSDISCATDLQMIIGVVDNTPVSKNYVGVPTPLTGELKEYVE